MSKLYCFSKLFTDELKNELEKLFPKMDTATSVNAIEEGAIPQLQQSNDFLIAPTRTLPLASDICSGIPFYPPQLFSDSSGDFDAGYFEHLPTLRMAINEVSLNTQAPINMIVCSAIATMATVAQGLFDVRSPTGSLHPLSLNTIIIAGSGERKTTVEKSFTKVFSDALEVINKHVKNSNSSFEADLKKWEREDKCLERAYVLAKKKNNVGWEEVDLDKHQSKKPKKLNHITMIHDDYSIEALLQSLYCNMPVASITTSEGAKVLNDINLKSMVHLNTLWDGGNVDVQRVTRDGFILKNARLTTSLMIQPKVLEKIMSKRPDELRSSGYLARALVCQPISKIGHRSMLVTKVYNEKLGNFHSRLMSQIIKLMCSLSDSEVSRQELILDQQAEVEWINYVNYVEHNMLLGNFYESVHDHASKLPENVLRVAAVIHAFEFAEGSISYKTLRAAIHICQKCSNDFIRCFVPPPQDAQDGERLSQYLYSNFMAYQGSRPIEHMRFDERFIRRNRVRQCGPFNKSALLNQALRYLSLQGRVRQIEEIGPNGNATVYIDLYPNYPLPVCSGKGLPIRPLQL